MNKQSIANLTFTTASLIVIGAIATPTAAVAQITNLVDSALEATVGEGAKAEAEETTETDVENVGGASTDSQTNAEVNDLTDADLSSLTDLENLVEKDGELEVKVEIDEEGVKVEADADLEVEVNDLAKVGICLDGSGSIASPDGSSLADCSQEPEVQSVPEPTAIASFLLFGGYLLSRRRCHHK
ncbi:MAG: PEP-CTERM sorting domain-containing protein [Oscillatoria sp. PMC 1051.18]|uniref:PEP-CTERM sorting domain-containing protein n=1 Tax=Oscillatoria salina TaxID=331517 RepID=UPI0013BE0638|nr:PEP-CTERM sorting domain-containing protein [Oscillatoria salina]MBZ8180800.1 PEP-CTERM sorting domain-containing protein [Oscillatoria salina IIICB1]MEC4892906.1 PEP-CTERM sorting domain-containing protein [Oscillatoria sp. PMC 1050.18]MEC5030827.1 PEP-CTERM sorting domain-containing protein [Oscillatoria sp. PMC 1051.18]NET88833.1 PEP-CTERM sorting domain-containing protein [Kamptonema sp. SIO1D9]